MPDRTLSIVFRNPHPQRSPISTELYLFRRDGSCTRIDYTNQGDFRQPEESSSSLAPTGMR
jgi:hypothetical protein